MSWGKIALLLLYILKLLILQVTVLCYIICCAAHMSSYVLIKVHIVYLYINIYY